MKFQGIGILPLETPSGQLKPFFRKKFTTAFRVYNQAGGASLRMKDMEKLAKQVASNRSEEDGKFVFDQQCAMFKKFFLFGKESITEEDFVQGWVNVAFGNEKQKREFAEEMKAFSKISFQSVDTNKDERISYDEFRTWYEQRSASHEMTKTVFDAIDADKDGTISSDEWTYAFMTFTLVSGPDCPFRLWYGSLVEEK